MSLSNKDDIQVSVCVVTYNQENYIAECLESLVTQQTSFKFEIIVGEDCSTDGTRAIVQQYVEQYPDLIIPLFYEENVGAVENVKRVYKAARGKYIAHMDGDDMALPTKLQKQFEALEANPNCNICSHDVFQVDKEGKSKKNNISHPSGLYTLLNLYEKMPFFAHSSKMFRNKYCSTFWDDVLCSSNILDIDVHFYNLVDGDIVHLGKSLGIYRVGVGVTFLNENLNMILIEGKERLFEKGLKYYENNPKNLAKFKKIYAKVMLQFAYIFAVYYSDKKKYKNYIYKSLFLYKLTFTQLCFILSLFAPKLVFKIMRQRSKFKINRSI